MTGSRTGMMKEKATGTLKGGGEPQENSQRK